MIYDLSHYIPLSPLYHIVIYTIVYLTTMLHFSPSDLGEMMALTTCTTTHGPLNNLPLGHPWGGPNDLKSLISNMLSNNYKQRPDAFGVLANMQKICREHSM